MGNNTKIQWCDATYNPWWGCTKVSPGCDHCYAEAFDKRVGGAHWGPHAERRRIGATTLNQVDKWNRDAERAAKRARVFCASMADVFDNAVPTEWRDELWGRIRRTPWLQWQMLTKRPQNIAKMLPPDWGHGFHNVWLGTTVENQQEHDRRWPVLAGIPARVRFLSAEPLLGPIVLPYRDQRPDWIIIGGESGPGARTMRYGWAADLLAQSRAAGIATFFKQIGSNRDGEWRPGVTGKGDDPTQWPEFFRVQEFPDA